MEEQLRTDIKWCLVFGVSEEAGWHVCECLTGPSMKIDSIEWAARA